MHLCLVGYFVLLFALFPAFLLICSVVGSLCCTISFLQVVISHHLNSFSKHDERLLDALNRMLPSTESVTSLFLHWHQLLVRPLLSDYYKAIAAYDAYPPLWRLSSCLFPSSRHCYELSASLTPVHTEDCMGCFTHIHKRCHDEVGRRCSFRDQGRWLHCA